MCIRDSMYTTRVTNFVAKEILTYYGYVKENLFDSIDYDLPITSTQGTGIIRPILRDLNDKKLEKRSQRA